jgi:hypothetical protein
MFTVQLSLVIEGTNSFPGHQEMKVPLISYCQNFYDTGLEGYKPV